MNAKELRDLFASGRAYVACDGERLIDEATAREADATAARALLLLAAAEANDGSTPETDTAVYDLGYRDESGALIKQDAIPIDFAQGMERQRNALAARVRELEEERCCTCRDWALKQPYSTMPPWQTLPWGTEK